MVKIYRKTIALLLSFLLLFQYPPDAFANFTVVNEGNVINLDTAQKFSVADSSINEWVKEVVGLEGGKIGVLKARLDSNWESIEDISYKVYQADGSEVFTTDVKALMGARAANVSDFSVYPLSGGGSVITWEGTISYGCSGTFQFAMLDHNGYVIKEATNISTQASTYNCYTGATELSNGHIAFFWQHAGNEYYLRIFDSNGNPVTEPTSITYTGTRELPAGATYEHSIAASNDGTFMITYHSNDSSYYQGVIYNNDGSQRTVNGYNHFKLSDFPKRSGGAISKVVGLSNGEYALYYRTHTGGKVKFFNSGGAAIGNEIDTDLVWDFISLATGGFLVADAAQMQAMHYANDGTLLEGRKPVDNQQGEGWEDVFFAGSDRGFGVYNAITGNLILHGMGGNTSPPVENSMINPASGTFDKYSISTDYIDVTVTLTPNGNTLTDILLDETTIGVYNYSYDEITQEVTIKKEYLATLETGLHLFTFAMSAGTNPTLTVTISDSAPQSSPQSCMNSIPSNHRCEDFESVDPDGDDYSPREIGEWNIAILQEDGNDDPDSIIGIFDDNGNQMLELVNDYNVGEYAQFKLTSGDSFNLVSFKAQGLGQDLYRVIGYRAGLPVPGAEYDFDASTLTTVEFTNPAWGNIDEFRIVQQNGEKDISLMIDDLVVADAEVDSEPVLPELGGTVSITGETKYGSVLTADLSGLTYTPTTTADVPTYQWYRGDVVIPGATSSTYTLVQADIGETIKVTVTADGTNALGSVTSEGTAIVEKADGPSAPSAPTEASKTTTSITLNGEVGQEYSKDHGLTWQDSPIFSGLTPDTEYTFVTRVKETATHKVSPVSAGTTIRTPNLTYRVTYNSNGSTGGSEPTDSNYYEQGATVTVLGNTGSLVRTGYTFANWNTQADGKGTDYAADATFPMGSADVILYAKWTQEMSNNAYLSNLAFSGGDLEPDFDPDVVEYTVYADAAVSNVYITPTVAPDATITVNGESVKSGTSFSVQTHTGKNTNTIIVTAQNGDTKTYTITVFRGDVPSVPPTYSVTYVGNGNTGGSVPVDSETYEQGETVTVLGNTSNLVRTGYIFAGWSTEADGSGTDYAAGTTFQMGSGNVTLYAKWTASPGDGGATPPSPSPNPSPAPTPSTPSPSAPSSPRTEVITVPVETGHVGSGSIVAQTPITRTTEPNGKINDHVVLTTERTKETVQSITNAGQSTARLVIPDEKDAVSQVKIDVHQEAIMELSRAKINLEIFTENARMIIPYQSFDRFEDDLFFRVVPLKEEAQRKEVESRARIEQIVKEIAQGQSVHVVARPMTIETNMQSRPVTLILPLRDVQLPTEEKELETFLANLVVYIEHSDGEKELVQGHVVEYKAGQLGLEFGVNKFSTFTILQMEGWGEYVKQHFHQAYIQGYEDGTFKPQNTVTRAEIATMLARLLVDRSLEQTTTALFPDVSETHWASEAIELVKQLGLMTGDNNERFNPSTPITRAEMAMIVARIKGKGIGEAVELQSSFSDVQASHWAAGAIEAAAQAGIVQGYENGTYRPANYLTRAEAVAIFNRLFDRAPRSDVQTPSFPDVPATHWAFKEIEEAAQDHFHVEEK